MIRFFAELIGRWKYIGKHYAQAVEHDLNGKAALQRVAILTKEADALEENIKRRDGMEEKGFWACEDGHESDEADMKALDSHTPSYAVPRVCKACGKPAKFIKRDETMSGKEKYESDKEREEAVKILESKREEIKTAQKAVDYFTKMAAQERDFAGRLRKLS